MSATIDNVFSVWSNLEDSYELKAKPKGIDRSTFFKTLVGYSQGKHKLPALLSKLNKEIEVGNLKSNEETLDKYYKLSETFKILGSYIETNGIPNKIDNLDMFLINAMGLLKEEMTKEDLLSKYNYYPNRDNKVTKYHFRVMLEEFNCLIEHIESDRDGNISHFVGIESVKDKFRMFTNDMMYNYLVSGYGSQEYMSKKFNVDCLAIIALLMREGTQPNVFFVSDPANIKDNKLFGKGELRFVRQIDQPCGQVVEYKFKELSVFCMYLNQA